MVWQNLYHLIKREEDGCGRGGGRDGGVAVYKKIFLKEVGVNKLWSERGVGGNRGVIRALWHNVQILLVTLNFLTPPVLGLLPSRPPTDLALQLEFHLIARFVAPRCAFAYPIDTANDAPVCHIVCEYHLIDPGLVRDPWLDSPVLYTGPILTNPSVGTASRENFSAPYSAWWGVKLKIKKGIVTIDLKLVLRLPHVPRGKNPPY